MKTRVYQSLKALHDKYGPQECGKLCQKLLAIAFRSAGCDVVERGVQGVDVDCRQPSGQKHAIEVKTTTGTSVVYEEKDMAALEQRHQQDGYEPILGVLRIHVFYEWMFVRMEKFQPGRLEVEALRPYRLRELEQFLEWHFDSAVNEHINGALQGSQAYLDGALRQQGVLTEILGAQNLVISAGAVP